MLLILMRIGIVRRRRSCVGRERRRIPMRGWGSGGRDGMRVFIGSRRGEDA